MKIKNVEIEPTKKYYTSCGQYISGREIIAQNNRAIHDFEKVKEVFEA